LIMRILFKKEEQLSEEINNYLRMQSSSSSSEILSYLVEGRIKDCKQCKGYRYSTYHCAQLCFGYFMPEGKDATIYYENEDLIMKILFEKKEHAMKFQNEMLELKNRYPSLALRIVMGEAITYIKLKCQKRILDSAYVTGDYDSPECLSLADILSNHTMSEVSLNHSPDCTLRGLENLGLLMPHVMLYKCHMAGQAEYPRYKYDDDNLIYASWDLHNYFDGLNLDTRTPEMALKYESCGDVEAITVNGVVYQRMRVNLIIEFRDVEIATAVGGRLKVGSEKTSNLSYRSYIHVNNIDNVKKYMDLKYASTMKEWNIDLMED